MSIEELTLVQEFMSEDFFTTDSTKESFRKHATDLRVEWEALRSDSPNVSTPLSQWAQARGRLQSALLALPSDASATTAPDESREQVRGFYRDLLDYLGFTSGYREAASSSSIEVAALDGDSAPLLVVFAQPVDDADELLDKDAATLLAREKVGGDDKEEYISSVSRFLSRRFLDEGGPAFALVIGGGHLLLTEAERWAEGRYLTIDLGLILDRADTKRGGTVDRFLACCSARAIAPQADGTTWFTGVLEDSVKHTERVSEDLREAVRRSIELIANEVVHRRRDQSLPSLSEDQAQPLAKQSLRFLYRILFLLYAEASPELEVVPAGSSEYEAGYGLDRLRELALAEIPSSGDGTHLYESLALLFRLIDQGHGGAASDDRGDLVFHALQADLFRPEATELINEVELGNDVLQKVLENLLLTKEGGKKERGFISYAELGINQLGNVYEGLMSFQGRFATEDLQEVAPNGDPSKGSWVVPVARAADLPANSFVRRQDPLTGSMEPVIHQKGAFVYRLSGRDRQQSASYYTPEVLTSFTVSQALEELLDADTPADDILNLTVCEPALGSGAFALEAVRQLAEQYLQRKQREVGERIDPAQYAQELQRVKAHLALHQVYGVDLNATAVELAEISLWLDTMVAGLAAPWFGLRLRRGNSLIGARRASYTAQQVTKRDHLTVFPRSEDLNAHEPMSGGRIFQFLLPAKGWGSAADAKEAKELAPQATQRINAWRKAARQKLSGTGKTSQVARLQELSAQTEGLWRIALRRLEIAQEESRRAVAVWGQEASSTGSSVRRSEIEAKLADQNGAYQRLRRVMDAWCALWFWPATTQVSPPSNADWIDALTGLLGRKPEAGSKDHGQGVLGNADTWEDLNSQEELYLSFAEAKRVERVAEQHPWLSVCERIAEEQGFFHWELDFATVFAGGGFDLQLGNPPWVRPRGDVEALLAEGDPWWQLAHKPSEAAKKARRESTLQLSGITRLVIDGSTDVVGTATFLSDPTTYPVITGTQPDLYRAFMAQTWAHESDRGITGLIHPETHFTDEKARLLRRETYPRLRRHWQFLNELTLFEIDHHVSYGVHIYGLLHPRPHFMMASSLFHPNTVEKSLLHHGEGPEPGIKTANGEWDVNAHAGRVIAVDDSTLALWRDILESPDVPAIETKMVYTVNSAALDVLTKLAKQPRIQELEPHFSRGWDESIDRKKGRFEQRWGVPDKWKDVILQGPHFHVAQPAYKYPNESMKHNLDWSPVDLERLAADSLPITSYKPIDDGEYDRQYTNWKVGDEVVPARNFYRVAWRAMAANTGERTLIPAIIPPGSAHINGVFSFAFREVRVLVAATATISALVSDFSIRVAPKSGIYPSAVMRQALPPLDHCLFGELQLRTLRLNCLTDAYADLWDDCWDESFAADAWTNGYGFAESVTLNDVGPSWTATTPLRLAADRRQALIENDALVALMLGITADELCTIYRTQFPVLFGYDRNRDHYDANGRLVPNEVVKTWKKLGDQATPADLTATHPQGHEYIYAPPFRTLDREADMRAAYAEFEARMDARS